MSEETSQVDNVANNGEVEVKSASSTHKDDSPIHFTDGTREGDDVQIGIVSKNEEESAEAPEFSEDSTEEKLPSTEEDGNQDHLVKQSEITEEKLGDTETQSQNDPMLPDHHNLSAEQSGSTEETIPDSEPMIPNDGHSGKITEMNQQPSLPFGDSLLLKAPNCEGDGPQQQDCETQDRETSSAEHGRPTSAYTASFEEYSLLLEQLTEERANAIGHHKKLQMKLAPILVKKPREEMESVTQGEVSEKIYEECVEMLTELKLSMKEDIEMAKMQTEELRMQAQEKLSKVDREWHELLSLKKDVAVTVLSRRLAKPFAVAKVESVLFSEEKHQDELTRLRLQNFSLENRIRRLELELSEADRNATNPFQREYEKLHAQRTERKMYREKRHKEALRVQRRVKRSLEMLSKVKQTLHNTETEVQHQLGKLAHVDAILVQHRNRLARVKQTRSRLERDNARLKEQCGLIGNEVLLRDYDYTKRANAELEEKVQDLKSRHTYVECYLNRRKMKQYDVEVVNY